MAASSAPAAAQNPLKTLRKASFPRPCRLRMVSLARPPPISALASSPSTAAAASPLSADARHRDDVLRAARDALSNCLSETYLDRTVPGLSSKARGKVRDIYDAEDHLVLVTTDRQSAFDRVLASIPFKGQVFLPVSINSDVLDMVLNETSLWWFNKTQHITPNAVVSAPDSNGLQYRIVPLGTLDMYQFDRGPVCLQVALENGLILVDTKYEFGKGADGTIMLIDEVGYAVWFSLRLLRTLFVSLHGGIFSFTQIKIVA
ncbi:hypothetical protein BHE74_00051152 [Ensete ventricosum]|nr:hypothetical protein BHE74_00051152 [Ensete ventricosum]